mmetsp:Transcript_133062/g.425779  ORF Transcript_133062/g.425779 Transcript_133062/m.425779 type:complete len:207 (-) Transcript_133062:405-1025(-)
MSDRVSGREFFELRYYSGHSPGSALHTIVDVEMQDSAFWVPEVANNVLIVGRKDGRHQSLAQEVPRLEFLAFRSDAEAAAFFDLLVATRRRDSRLAGDARSRMQLCVSERQRERQVPSRGDFECWTRELVNLSPALTCLSPELPQLREQRRLRREAMTQEVVEALARQAADVEEQMARHGAAGVAGGSSTVVVFQASNTVVHNFQQ